MSHFFGSIEAGGRYRALLVAALLFAVFFLMNPAIIADWRSFSFDDGSYSHAYLIPFMCAYLLWDANARQRLNFEPKPWLLMPLTLALYALLVAQAAQFAFLERVLTPLPLLFAMLCVFQFRFAVVIPVALLWFITPVWGVLIGPLQESSSRAVEAAMQLTGIPTYVDGNFVHIPAGVFEIAEGCSGLRYVVSALAIALFYCHLYLRSWRSILLFTAIAVVGAIVTNWVRILLLVLLGHYSDMQSEIIRDHNMFGWYLFIPFMLLLVFLGRRLEGGGWEQGAAGSTTDGAHPSPVPRGTLLSVTGLLVVFSGVVIDTMRSGQPALLIEPVFVDDMQASPALADSVSPVLYGDFTRKFLSPAGQKGFPPVHVYEYSGTGPVAKPDFYLNSVIPQGWSECERPSRAGAALRYTLCREDERAVLDVLYRVGHETTASEAGLQGLRLLQALRLQTGSTLYWWFVPCDAFDCRSLGGRSTLGPVARDAD